ncbi:MAG: ribonuclease P protein component [Dehalogenimonas sp.]|jgi:ribonuclease P protein component|uniref:Ribonuclease P protein component n=1 Tax=Candidatus Dehalogenimonas loeffleri TaxID=3127115 RepID=A0ABZ2J6H5_9CHLR|nr:ribonuclease P protein component [Dehalogenimonas sp.]
MAQYYSLKDSREFRRIMNGGRGWSDARLVIKIIPGHSEHNRIGIVVSKKVGAAVVRNRVRRRIKEIFRQKPLEKGYDIVVIARQAARDASYHQLVESAQKLTGRAGLVIQQ